MRKVLAVLLAILLLPAIPTANAENNLLYVGPVDTMDGRLVHMSFTSSSTVVTLTSSGNLSEHFWGGGELITQWSIELNATANSATIDSTGLQVAVAHSKGVYIVNTQSRTITSSYNSSSSVDYVVWDTEGDLWFGYYGGERRAKEYDLGVWTGTATPSHNTAMTAMTIISENRIVTGGRDNLVKVTSQSGDLETSLADFNSYPTIIVNDGSGNIIVGCANGDLFRYDFDDWTFESTSISSGETILSVTIADDGKILVGAQNGHLHVIDDSTFTEDNDYSSQGRVIFASYGTEGELYVVTTFSTSSQIRLFDLDTDGDLTTDSLDAFPFDNTQSVDTDGDGYGDNPDGNNPDFFPSDFTQWNDTDGDGYGDNPDGNNSDAFPLNNTQWSDSDGDGFGDITNAELGDRYPNDPTQWVDSDFDGFGDNISGTNGDHCPNENGFSTIDRKGCRDSDGDGYSDPTDDEWTTENGADFFIRDASQWSDSDGDGYGDNLSGFQADSCPTIPGNSTDAYVPELAADGSLTPNYVVIDKFGCIDDDGDGFANDNDNLPNDARDYIDSDGDKVGKSQDFDDTNRLIQTKEDYCSIDTSDESEMCLGVRDVDYQNYLLDLSDDEETLDYYEWKRSENANPEDDENIYLSAVKEVAPFLGAAFVIIVAVLMIYASVGKSRRRRALIKTYGIPLTDGENSAEEEALEGKAGLSAAGGVDSDKFWDDDVEPMALEESDDGVDLGFADIDIKGDQVSETTEVMEESASLEELAGLPPQTTVQEEAEKAAQVPQNQPPTTPPLPAEGLPEGWTMEQWKWYGAEWLSKQGK